MSSASTHRRRRSSPTSRARDPPSRSARRRGPTTAPPVWRHTGTLGFAVPLRRWHLQIRRRALGALSGSKLKWYEQPAVNRTELVRFHPSPPRMQPSRPRARWLARLARKVPVVRHAPLVSGRARCESGCGLASRPLVHRFERHLLSVWSNGSRFLVFTQTIGVRLPSPTPSQFCRCGPTVQDAWFSTRQ